MDRREFSAGAAAVAALSATKAAANVSEVIAYRPNVFRDLPEERSKDGLLKTTLNMRQDTFKIGGHDLTLANFGGSVPGKIVRLKPGDRLQWRLKNNMDKDLGLPLDNGPPSDLQKSLNYTNVHTHGLQVSPRDGGDNVYIVIEPGDHHDYTYDIPGPETGRPQPAGMHWYHPHKHGSTSHQGWQGLAGPIIIEGDIDEVPEVKAATERVMVLNEIIVDDKGETPTALIVPTVGQVPFTSRNASPLDIIFPINGVLQPNIPIAPGETQRWRVLAAGPHRFFHLSLQGHTLWQISQDGIPFSEAREMDTILMAPGNRVEFIIKGGPPGEYAFKALAYDQGHPGGARPEKLLGTLVSGGKPKEGKLPGKLVPTPTIPDEVYKERTIVFKGDIASVPVQFYLDGQKFSAERIDQTVFLGTTEEWTLVNEDVFQHPFHIHVNPFLVTEINDKKVENPVWWDTFAIPPRKPDGTPGTAKVKMFFRPDISGLTVYHCHILPHEDNGMMANILLFDPPNGFGPNPGSHGDHG